MNNVSTAIENLVRNSYIEGVHQQQNKDLVLKGFHKDFEMLVLNNNQVEKVGIDKWLERVRVMKKESPEFWQAATSYNFSLLDSTDVTASVKIDVFKGSTHFSTDYMLLYKIDGEWKAVSKIFTIPK